MYIDSPDHLFRHALAPLLTLALFVLCPAPAQAQTATAEPDASAESSQSDTNQSNTSQSDADEYFGESHRKEMYKQTKKSSTRALLYTLALPGLGNVYAEQYFIAGLAFSLMAFTTMFVLYGLSTQQPQFLHMGLVTGGVAYTGGAVSSHFGVRKYNKRLREGFNLDGESSLPKTPYEIPAGRAISFTIRF